MEKIVLTSVDHMNGNDILDFWFAPEHQAFWFAKSDAFDQKIASQFSNIHTQAAQSELWSWRETAEGRLAEIIVLDQFSRNLFRNHPRAFAQDAMALALAQEAVAQRIDQQLDPTQRQFLYMPFMHSESAKVHQVAVMLFQRLNNPVSFDFEKQHQAIIQRFGRYPHRNEILGRTSSEEERSFLLQPNSSF